MKKKISVKDITSSPYFIAVLLILVILLVIGSIVYLIMGILTTKKTLVDTRQSYQQNVQEIAVLEELRAQSEQAKEQLAAYKDILPDELGDIYQMEDDINATCKNFGLKVTEMQEPTQITAETAETSFIFKANGSYSDIISYLQYMTTLEQMHRIDALSLSINESDTESGGPYVAEITLTVLSRDGAKGIITAAEDTATAS